MSNKENIVQLKTQSDLKHETIIGIVKKFNNRFGFLRSKHKVHYFIPKKYINRVINGDKILVKILYKNEKCFVKPLVLIKSFLNIFIGSIKIIGMQFFIQPQYPFLKELIICNFDNIKNKNVENGDWFFAKLVHHKLKHEKEFYVYLIKCIAKSNDNLLPWKVILTHYNIDYLSPKIDIYNFNFQNNIFRLDLTHLKFITIDNEDTQDIDDALFLTQVNDQIIKIIIAISDPTAYINSDSELDILASKRLFTYYTPGLTIPMFPKYLSENIFSLHPNTKKPVLACEVYIDKNGNITQEAYFFLAWIKSSSKLNYHNVTNWIQNVGLWKPETVDIANQLNLLHTLCNRRIKWRKKNALIFKEQPEYKFHLSKQQDIINISIEYKNIANKMIEEAMIIANISAAKFLSKHLGFGIYNIHSGFHKIHAKYISLIVKKYGINIHSEKIITLVGFCELYRSLDKISNSYIDNRIRKHQSLATMSLTPKPHFGLGFQEYLTWTSPIRKYSDMINHRLLKNVILGYPVKKPSNNIILNIIHYKRFHRIIKKNIENWLYIKFFQKNNLCNKIFRAKIFDILPCGIKARILINGANIFIPIFYIHHIKKELVCDQKNGILYLRNKELYRVSNTLTIIIVEINVTERIIIAKPHI